MIFIGYHPTCSYNLYNPVDKKVHIRKYVVFDESEAWKWQTKYIMEGEVKHIFVDYDDNEESNDETNGEEHEVGEVVQT